MITHQLFLDEDFNNEFSLIAIHCTQEAFKMAYMLNKQVPLHLVRKDVDVDLSSKGLDIAFPIFEYEDTLTYYLYSLVANKNNSVIIKKDNTTGLFKNETLKKTITTYLLNQYKNVDYFLKIYSDYEKVPTKNIVSIINNIEQVISAYAIDITKVKSKNNLIFS